LAWFASCASERFPELRLIAPILVTVLLDNQYPDICHNCTRMKQVTKTLIRALVDRLPVRTKLALASLLIADNRIPPNLAAALRASDAGDHSTAERTLEQAMSIAPMDSRLTTRAFLSRQWLKWRNPDEGHSMAKEDFALGERWRVALDKTDDIFPEFFNQVWQRAGSSE
jgi:hypothetical protein